jgi:hypothetical protein
MRTWTQIFELTTPQPRKNDEDSAILVGSP